MSSNGQNSIRVLHITPWFPSADEPYVALWIKRHIDALAMHCESVVWHVQTTEGKKFANKYLKSEQNLTWKIRLPTHRWFLIELVTLLQLLFLAIIKRKVIKGCQVVNFHIAYPSLTYWWLLKFFYPRHVLITEHWSAYHFQFGVEKKLPRIQRIFHHGIPVITVSSSLRKDIEIFSGVVPAGMVIPNVVDTSNFYFAEEHMRSQPTFFMVSLWKYPKDPVSVIKTFKTLILEVPEAQLRIGGYGPLEEEIQEAIKVHDLEASVHFLGALSGQEIAGELRKSTAFIHLSAYETFSVVCAEAICCGCPVVASDVGGISEFISDENGILLSDRESLEEALRLVINKPFNRAAIASEGEGRFSPEVVGAKYFHFLNRLKGVS